MYPRNNGGATRAMVSAHTQLEKLSGSPPPHQLVDATVADLRRTYRHHACIGHDEDACCGLEHALRAWRELGRPAALWHEVRAVVEDHIERSEARAGRVLATAYGRAG